MLLQGDTGRGRRGWQRGGSGCAQYGGSTRWRRGEERDVMCDPWKTKPREFHPFSSSFTSVSPASTPFPVSANLLLPVNVTRSTARGRSCTGSDEISTNLFCYHILIRFVLPFPPPPTIQSRGRNSDSTNAHTLEITMEMVPNSRWLQIIIKKGPFIWNKKFSIFIDVKIIKHRINRLFI